MENKDQLLEKFTDAMHEAGIHYCVTTVYNEYLNAYAECNYNEWMLLLSYGISKFLDTFVPELGYAAELDILSVVESTVDSWEEKHKKADEPTDHEVVDILKRFFEGLND